MKTYIGTKVVKATPMTNDTFYSTVKGGSIQTSDLTIKTKEGYLVEYEDGYKSWSPKDVFEKAYKEVTEDVAHAEKTSVGFWGGFASRRKNERDEAIVLLREASENVDELIEVAEQEGYKGMKDNAILLQGKIADFLKRF